MSTHTEYYLISFCNTGFECIQNITEYVPENFALVQAQARLSGDNHITENPILSQISNMKIRAMANNQRAYEIYTISTTGGVIQSDITDWAESDPQSLADWVRKNHKYCHYDHRRLHSEKKLIV
jgi:hypothetical protein